MREAADQLELLKPMLAERERLRPPAEGSGDALVDLWNYATDYREHPTFDGFVERAQELGIDPARATQTGEQQ
jgi:hypothetical protein